MASRTAILAAGALLLGPACIYTDPINRAPHARIVEESRGPYYVETPIVVSASKSADPDGDPVSVQWSAQLCPRSGGDCHSLLRQQEGSLLEPLVIDGVPGKGRVVVQLTVRDLHGAMSGDELGFEILNRPPEVELQVQGDRLAGGGYLVGRELVAVSEAVDPDGDEVELAWSIIPPSASDPNEVVFEPLEDDRYRIVPDAAGLWEVEVIADDGDGGIDTASRPFQVVADGPPCIAATEPLAPGDGAYVLGVDDAPRRFAVLSVEDELDAYPPRADDPDAGEASFRWLLASSASDFEYVELSGRDAPDFVLDPAEHAPGDALALRVEVHDRTHQDVSCRDDLPTCSIGDDDACIQRTTWEVEIR